MALGSQHFLPEAEDSQLVLRTAPWFGCAKTVLTLVDNYTTILPVPLARVKSRFKSLCQIRARAMSGLSLLVLDKPMHPPFVSVEGLLPLYELCCFVSSPSLCFLPKWTGSSGSISKIQSPHTFCVFSWLLLLLPLFTKKRGQFLGQLPKFPNIGCAAGFRCRIQRPDGT